MPDIEPLTRRITAVRDLFNDEKSFPVERIADLAGKIYSLIGSSHRIAFVGNGGSAAEAMHIAAEFTGKCVIDHPPFPVLCLNESQSSLTAIANDYGVEHIFSRMVQAHLRKGDLLVCLSTSGKSRNIVEAVKVASKEGIDVVVWMGDFESSFPDVDVWKAPSRDTPRIQEIHLVWGHLISELVELSWQNQDVS